MKSEIKIGNLIITLESYECFYIGNKVNITTKQLELLYILASNPGKVLSREFILFELGDSDRDSNYSGRKIDLRISNIRKIFNCSGDKIKTISGKGYLFIKRGWE